MYEGSSIHFYSYVREPNVDSISGYVKLVDLDGDGMLAWQEYVAGTDPSDSNSVFKIIAIDRSGQITWLGGTNIDELPFNIYRSTNLLNTGAWGLVTSYLRTQGSNGTNTYTDADVSNYWPHVYHKVSTPGR